MAVQIPDAWRMSVCRILRSGDRYRIDIKKRALDEWNAATNHSFRHLLYSALFTRLTRRIGRRYEDA